MIQQINWVGFALLILLFTESSVSAQEKLAVSGMVQAGLNYSRVSGDQARRGGGYSAGLTVNFRYKKFTLPLRLRYSENAFSYSSALPFSISQIGFRPKWKWGRAHLGHSNMAFSRYTLAGTSFFGVGLELTPGKFRFKLLKGKFRSNFDFNRISERFIDNFISPEFNRNGQALSIGFGSRKNHADLILVHFRDTKLDNSDVSAFELFPFLNDGKPKENLLLGQKASFTFFKRLHLRYDIAASIITSDLNHTEVDIDLGSTFLDKLADKLLTPTVSSRWGYAGEAEVSYRLPAFSVGLSHKRVSPFFNSLGSRFLQRDFMYSSFNTSINLLDQKLTLNTNVGLRSNNQSGIELNTSNSLALSVSGNYRWKERNNLFFSFNNFNDELSPNIVVLEGQPVISSSSTTATLGNTFLLSESETKNWSLNNSAFYSNNQVLGGSEFNQEFSTLGLNSNVVFTKKSIDLTATTGISYTTSKVEETENRYGVRFDLRKKFFDNALSVRLGSLWELGTIEGLKNTFQYRLIGNMRYRITDKTTVTGTFNYQNRTSVLLSDLVRNRFNVRVTQKF